MIAHSGSVSPSGTVASPRPQAQRRSLPPIDGPEPRRPRRPKVVAQRAAFNPSGTTYFPAPTDVSVDGRTRRPHASLESPPHPGRRASGPHLDRSCPAGARRDGIFASIHPHAEGLAGEDGVVVRLARTRTHGGDRRRTPRAPDAPARHVAQACDALPRP